MQNLRKTAINTILALTIMSLFGCNKTENNNTEMLPIYKIKNNTTVPIFNSDNAFNYIKEQLKYGPRVPNSLAQKNCSNYLANELNKYADKTELQNFSLNVSGTKLDLVNIIGRFNPDSKKRILLCAHWDSRPWADMEKDESKHKMPIPGANDGASGVGILLDIARILKENKINYGVDIVFFDGEDYGDKEAIENYCLGAKYFSNSVQNSNLYAFGILLDMVGDPKAVFKQETNSINSASEITSQLWDIATKLNATCFKNSQGGEIIDDHLPLNQIGIKTVDIIDAGLIGHDPNDKARQYWHTLDDNIDKISKETLQQVGNVLVKLIYSIEFDK